VLFLCTHNSARSQMAEGLLRAAAGDRYDAFSAGTEATHVRPLAIRAMAELGIDISRQESKTLDRYLDQRFDAVITVCDDANESCPVFPGAAQRLHWSFPDPSRARGSEEEQLAVYRAVRDAIGERIRADLLQTKEMQAEGREDRGHYHQQGQPRHGDDRAPGEDIVDPAVHVLAHELAIVHQPDHEHQQDG
jgi:arsenate reductase